MMTEPVEERVTALTDERLLDDTMTVLSDHIPLPVQGYRYQTADLWRVLIMAAASGMTIETACASLATAPHPNTVRTYLADHWTPEVIPLLEGQINAALQASLPAWLWDRPLELAADCHDCPFYGKHDPTADDDWVSRGKPKAGTTRFYRCATLACVERDARVTLALVFVYPGETMDSVLERLLLYAHEARLRIACLYGDKAFCTSEAIRFLRRQQIPAVLALPIRGKLGGTRALCRGQGGRWTTYTFHPHTRHALTVKVAVARTLQQQRHGPPKLAWCLFVCLGVFAHPTTIRKRYRRRFGIETTYRLLEQARVRTTSRNPALRWMLISVAAIVENVWIWTHWRYLRHPGRGPRRVARALLRFMQFRTWLRRAVERIYDAVLSIDLTPFRPVVADPPKL